MAVMILYSYKPNPVMNSYGATAVITFIGCAWMGYSFLRFEHPVHTGIAVVSAGSRHRYAIGQLASLTGLALLFNTVIVLYPVVLREFAEPAGLWRLAVAWTGSAMLGLLGIAISLFLQPPWIRKASYAAGIMLTAVIVSIGSAQIGQSLPGFLDWLVWLLPPVSQGMEVLLEADKVSTLRIAGSFIHSGLYSLLIMLLYVYSSGRKDA